ncbi:gluconokinase [Burkholderia pyrrocinia]|uniref:gluconokinase n=1 Tax=Burkholderia pyrrocinia TaxID=60550 RepID=UPI001BD14822|nr:gluconokinase, GntK/IdnK-type [Burkholderia pyrrocinia]QVN23812.1 gluconokinase [Burkholderia pyrrocinia]
MARQHAIQAGAAGTRSLPVRIGMASVESRHRIVVMGVSGCGKSTLGAMLAAALGGVFVEGDDYHLPESKHKMRNGIALDDSDRQPWLDVLASMMTASSASVVLSCSALRAAYRTRLRARVPGLRFVYLEIGMEEALKRVSDRVGHAFPAGLVSNQFDTLESPVGEDRVLCLLARDRQERNLASIVRWLDGSMDTVGE